MEKLIIKNLSASINNKAILKNINLEINKGEIIAIVGPNGHGKSTLLKTLMHHYMVDINEGQIIIDNDDIDGWEPNEIATKGLFFAPQHSEEIPGVLMIDYLKSIINSRRKDKISLPEFYKKVETNLKDMNMDREYLHRFVNCGFSGGEKKKSEILQMKLLDPDFVMLDEIDSGLDVDSLKKVIEEIKKWHNNQKTLIIVSHHENLFKEIKPTKVIVIYNGVIAKMGGNEILEKIYSNGYLWISKEMEK